MKRPGLPGIHRVYLTLGLALLWTASAEGQATDAPAPQDEPPTTGPPAGATPPHPSESTGAPSVAAAEEPEGLPEIAASWGPPTRQHSGWDWVLMTSGEWLKGELKSMRDSNVEFDSDEFGLQQLDLDDVAAFYAYRPHTYQLEDRSTLQGVATLRGNELVIGEQTLAREDLMGVVEGTPSERNYWSMKLNLSLAMRRGNTNQATLSDTLFVRRDAPGNRLTLDTNGTFGRVDGAVNIQTQTAVAQFDVFLSRVFYLIPAFAQVTHDRFQNIDLRAIPGSGLGVHAVDQGGVTWDIDGGGGYHYLNFREVESGEEQIHHDGVVRLATRLTVEVVDPLDVALSWASSLVVSDMDRTFHRGTLSLELDITDAIDSTISVIYDRIERPERREDGTLPKRDDVQLNFGIQLELG